MTSLYGIKIILENILIMNCVSDKESSAQSFWLAFPEESKIYYCRLRNTKPQFGIFAKYFLLSNQRGFYCFILHMEIAHDSKKSMANLVIFRSSYLLGNFFHNK